MPTAMINITKSCLHVVRSSVVTGGTDKNITAACTRQIPSRQRRRKSVLQSRTLRGVSRTGEFSVGILHHAGMCTEDSGIDRQCIEPCSEHSDQDPEKYFSIQNFFHSSLNTRISSRIPYRTHSSFLVSLAQIHTAARDVDA